jgi:intein/homing endonuclease
MKDIISGDLVLSYNFNKQEFENKKVIDSLDKGIKETKEIKIRNGTKIYATPNHKFYYRHNIYKNREGYKPYSELNNHYDRLTIVRDLMDCEDFDINDNLIYLYGVYMAEGSHHEGEGRCFLAQSEEKNREKYYKIKEKLDMLGIIYSETKRRNGFTLFSENPINKKLQSFGTYHYNKKFPDEIFKYSKRQLEILLEGLLDGDGWRTKPKINKDGKKSNIEFGYTSTSYELIKQISWILRRLGKPANMWSRLPSNRKYRQYNLSYNSNSWFNKEYKKGISLVGFEEIRPCETHVWDINVEDNNNFVLYESGLVVHNCAEGHFKIQEMEKKGWRTTPMSFKKDKVEKYTTFRSKLRQGKIKSYRDGALGVEMKALQEEEGIRSTKIHKPLGGTDDLIDCFVMACYHYLDNGGTELRVYDW